MFQYCKDVHELGLVPYKDPGWYIWKQKMEQMSPPYPALAERMVIATSWEEFHNITQFKLLAKDRRTNFPSSLLPQSIQFSIVVTVLNILSLSL